MLLLKKKMKKGKNAMTKNAADLLKEAAEEYKKNPEAFMNNKNEEIDPIIDELVEIEKRHKYALEKSNTRARRIDLRDSLDKSFKKLMEQ